MLTITTRASGIFKGVLNDLYCCDSNLYMCVQTSKASYDASIKLRLPLTALVDKTDVYVQLYIVTWYIHTHVYLCTAQFPIWSTAFFFAPPLSNSFRDSI